ncbi:MAG: tetratricopeptide repeat protein [Bacteroidetes bacterium]|nr:tetratricopeptide repeat protein [Bacteroidota bacterium]
MAHPNHNDHEAFGAARWPQYREQGSTFRRVRANLGLVPGCAPSRLPTVLVGDEGSGKSALSAYLAHECRKEGSDIFVLHAEAYPAGSGPLAMLHDVAHRIAQRYRVHEPVPDNPEQLVRAFPQLLACVQGPLLLVLDGLDHLSLPAAPHGSEAVPDAGGMAGWLPAYIPPNIRLLVSTRPGELSHELAAREWEIVEVELLDLDARRALAMQRIAGANPAIGAEVARLAESDGIFGNGMALGTGISEVLRLSAMEGRGSAFEYLKDAANPEELLDLVLGSMEADYGRPTLESVLAPLASTRAGLAVEELSRLSRIDADRINHLLSWLDLHLQRRGSLIRCSDGTFRSVLVQRYLPDEETRRAQHRAVAGLMEHLPPGERRGRELPWQWMMAGAWEQLRECVTPLEMVHHMVANGMQYDLLHYLHWLGEASAAAMYEQEAAALARKKSGSRPCHAEWLASLAMFLSASGALQAAEQAMRNAAAVRVRLLGPEHPDTLAAHAQHATLLVDCGAYEQAETPTRQVLDAQIAALGEEHPDVTESRCNLGYLLFRRGEYAAARSHLERACKQIVASGATDTMKHAMALKLLAMPVRDAGRLPEACGILEEAVRIATRVMGSKHPEVALLKTEHATLLHVCGNHEAAKDLLIEALAVREEVLGPLHIETGHSYNNLAQLYVECPELDTEGCAEDYYRCALNAHVVALGDDHPDSAVIRQNLGKLLRDAGRCEEALPLFRTALRAFQVSVGQRHKDTVICMGNLGELLCMGRAVFEQYGVEPPGEGSAPDDRSVIAKRDEARVLLERAYELMLELFGENDPGTANAVNRLVQLAFFLGDLRKSDRLAGEALRIYEESGVAMRRPAAVALYRKARARYWMGDREEACRLALRACELFQANGSGRDPYAAATARLVQAACR